MIGLVLDYRRDDAAIAALHWASLLESSGLEVQVYPLDGVSQVNGRWDTRASRCRTRSYSDWVGTCEKVIHATMPLPATLLQEKDKGIETAVFCTWDNRDGLEYATIKLADLSICPSRSIHRQVNLLRLPLRCNIVLPWCSSSPLVDKDVDVDPQRIGVAWNLDGDQVLRQDDMFLTAFAELLQLPFLFFTVFFNDRLPSGWKSRLEVLRFKAGGRLEVMRNPSIEQIITVTAAHDVTVWPSLQESFALPGLLSLIAGVPCVAYDHPVIGEVIKDGKTGVLVPCELAADLYGVPRVVADNPTFVGAVASLVHDPGRLQDLRRTAQSRLANRQRDFRTSSLRILATSSTTSP